MAFDLINDTSTIAAFRSPDRMQDLGIVGSGTTDRINESAPGLQEFKIRMANSLGTREAASLLLNKMCSWRGYSIETPARS